MLMNMLVLSALISGALVIVGLTTYAWRLWRGVRRQNHMCTQRKADAQADMAASVRALAKSLLAGDLNLSEGAIRLKVMLDHLHPDGSGERLYSDIYALHDATAHMLRGGARKAPPRSEIRALDAKRERLEAHYRESIHAETQRLLELYTQI